MSFSVLMSVYANENPVNLDQSLISIWDQQTLIPEQIVLVKDGPLTPELDLLIGRWVEKLGKVITLVVLPKNLGLSVALNKGLELCRHDLVTRMDTDDLSVPDRFEKQVKFMMMNPDIAVSSGVVEEIRTFEQPFSKRKLPLTHSELVRFAKRRSPISHPAAIFRKDAVLSVGGYPAARYGQDYALWVLLIMSGYKLANLPDSLVKMRIGKDFYSRRGLQFFTGEIGIYYYMYKIKFLSINEYLYITVARSIFSILPRPIMALFYKYR